MHGKQNKIALCNKIQIQNLHENLLMDVLLACAAIKKTPAEKKASLHSINTFFARKTMQTV